MKISSNRSFSSEELVVLQDQSWLDKQRIAGKVVARTLTLLEDQVKNKTKLSLVELNNIAEKFILDHGCEITFKGYKGFPAGVCISINKQLVHGIPTNYLLQEGDVVSFDLGATFEGAIADSALTCIYGSPKCEEHIKLLKITKESLAKGIESIKIGNRIGCIGNAIYKYVKNNGYCVIHKYGGHSLTWNNPHSPPFISNKSTSNEGIRIQSGLTIAIEPLVCKTSSDTRISSDGWTVETNDISAHFEDTIYIHNDDHIEVITQRN